MKSTAEIKTNQERCSTGYEKSPRTSRALKITTYSSTTNPAHSSLFPLNSGEAKAVRAHTLQVEQRRSMAIENARRATYL